MYRVGVERDDIDAAAIRTLDADAPDPAGIGVDHSPKQNLRPGRRALDFSRRARRRLIVGSGGSVPPLRNVLLLSIS
jgi:hypothetical protein